MRWENASPIQRPARRKRNTTDATYKVPNTWAQIAIIPRNNDNEASAAASSTTARNIVHPCWLLKLGRETTRAEERKENIVLLLFYVKRSEIARFPDFKAKLREQIPRNQ